MGFQNTLKRRPQGRPCMRNIKMLSPNVIGPRTHIWAPEEMKWDVQGVLTPHFHVPPSCTPASQVSLMLLQPWSSLTSFPNDQRLSIQFYSTLDSTDPLSTLFSPLCHSTDACLRYPTHRAWKQDGYSHTQATMNKVQIKSPAQRTCRFPPNLLPAHGGVIS